MGKLGSIFLFIMVFFTSESFAIHSFKAGSEVRFTYFDIYDIPFLPDNFFQYNGFIYAGFESIFYIGGFSQIQLTILPGLLLKSPKLNETQVEASFFFRDIYFTLDLMYFSTTVGKRALAWGVGNVRQFSFFSSKAHAEEDHRYYNVEFRGRTGPALFSVGTALDTESIDLLKEPKWFTPWAYLRIDHKKFSLLSSFNMFWKKELGYDIKLALEMQFFLPKGFEFYYTFAYYPIYESSIGKVNEIRFLTGFSYEYIHSATVFIIPSIEYVWEDYDHIMSIGIMAQVHANLTLMAFTQIDYTKDEVFNPSLLTRAVWNTNRYVSVQFEYRHYFKEIGDVPIKNHFSMRIVWQI